MEHARFTFWVSEKTIYKKVLLPALTWPSQNECVELFRNPPRRCGRCQSADCLFYKLLLGLSAWGPLPTLLPALVWLHLSSCEIRTRFTSRSSEQHLGGRRAVQSALSLQTCTIMLPLKCFVTAERASFSGLLLLRAPASEGHFFLTSLKCVGNVSS